MSFGEAIKSGFRNYVTFSGRATRSEYWYWTLFMVLGSVGAFILDSGLGTFGMLGGLFALAMFLPANAVSVRRLHDTGRSAWWLLFLWCRC